MKVNYFSIFYKKYKNVILFFLLFIPFYSLAQNCTVNANADKTICPGGSLTLLGTANSELDYISDPVWTQIAGPSAQIVNPNSLFAVVNGLLANNTYTFRLSATCEDGSSIYDDVTYTVLNLTTAIAGEDKTYCQGTYSLTGNSPVGLEYGTWSIEGNNGAGVSIADSGNSSTSITVSGESAGSTTLRWTISRQDGECESYDEIVITSLGGVEPVYAGNDQTVSECYSGTQTYRFDASFGGDSSDQQGTWTVVSGPSNPTFDDVNDNDTVVRGLIEGTYVFRWTVNGSCVQGSDEITITVPPPTADLTNVPNSSEIYCDGRTSIVLQGNVPQYINEDVEWTFISGPVTPTIVSPNTPSTVVNGLTVPGTYKFQYSIFNTTTNCRDNGTYTIEMQEAISISGGPDQVLACGVDVATIPVTSTGSGAMSWQVISGPTSINPLVEATYAPYPSPLNNFSGNSFTIENLNVLGSYVVRIIKSPEPGASCTTVYDDVVIQVSTEPITSNGGSDQVLACNVKVATLAGNIGFGGGTGKWSQISGPNTANIETPNFPTTEINGLISGKYQFRWTTIAGVSCDVSQSTVSVTVSDTTPTTPQAGLDENVCYGPLQLHANATLNNETGTWTVSPSEGIVFSDVNDPETTVSGLQENMSYTFTWTISNACGVPLSDDVVITTNNTEGAILSDAGPDKCLPDGTSSIQLEGNDPGTGTGVWTQISGNGATITNANLYNTTVTGLLNGDYVFRWTINSGGTCTNSEDDVNITIAPVLTIAAAGSDQVICGGTTVTLTGNTPSANEIGLWELVSGGDGPIITSPNSPTTTITNLTKGPWVFSWTISNSACGESTDSVKITVSENPSPAIAGEDQELCGQNSTTLGATPPVVGTGTWSLVSGPNSPVFGDATKANSTFSGLITGVYVLEWTTFNGISCPSSQDQVSITVREGANAGDDFNTCLSGPLYLEGTIGTTGTWTNVTRPIGAPVPVITNTGGNSASITNLVVGDYVFRYTIAAQGSCGGSFDDVAVTIDGQPSVANAGIDQQLCNTGTIQLAAQAPTNGIGKWSVLTGTESGTFIPNDEDPSARYVNASSGIYVFNWTISDGSCSNSDQVRVENAAPPTVANAGPDQDTVCGTIAQLAANAPTAGVGNWSQVSGPNTAVFSSQISPNATVSGLAKGTYVFQWTITNGAICNPSEDVVNVVVTEDITTPNAGPDQTICISPNPATLAGNALTVGTGTWTGSLGVTAANFSNINSPTSTFTPPSAGVFTLTWTSSQGTCSLSDSMTVTVDGLPSVANAGTYDPFCQFESIVLNATTPVVGTGTWTDVTSPSLGSVVFVNPNSPTTEVLGTVAGNYQFQWTIRNGLCNASSAIADVEILELPSLADAGSDQTLCNVGVTTLAGNNPAVGSGQWTFVSNAGNTAVITNSSAYNTTVTGISVGTTRLRWTISTGEGCTDYFDEVSIVRSSDLVVSELTPKVICLGGTANFSATASGSVGPYTYQWQSSNDNVTFSNITGAVSSSFTTPNNLTVGVYYYRVNVSSSCTSVPVTSNSVRLDVVADPVIVTNPLGQNLCAGNTHSMSVSATGNPLAGAIVYQWQNSADGSNYSDISGATSANYTTPALTTTTYYRAKVTQTETGCEINSDPAIVYVASITTQPTDPNPVCDGGEVTMSLTTSGNAGSATFSYQWQIYNGTEWVDISGANSDAYTSDSLSLINGELTTYQFRCVVSVDYASPVSNCTITSTTINALVAPDLNFTTQPKSGTICTGGSYTLSVEASSYANYQWQSSSNGATDWINVKGGTGGTSATYTTPALTENTFYRVILSNPSGGCEDVISNTVEVVVSTDPEVTDIVGSTVCPGGMHTMSVTVSGGIAESNYLYQWQVYDDEESRYTNITAANSSTYTTDALTANTQYRVRVRQSEDGCEVFSNEVIVYVATITTQPVTPATVCVGGTINLTITASGNGGSDDFTYQWQSSLNGSLWNNESNSTATTANFISDPLSTTLQFRCIVTSSITNCDLISDAVMASVVADPIFTLQPQSEAICAGGSVTLSANATTGTGTFFYQWQVNTGSGYTDIAGANTSTYTTPNLTGSTQYRVTANSSGAGCEQATSAEATITVNSDPIIITPPSDQTICGNGGIGATLTVVASGGVGAYNYQWQTAPSLGGVYVNISGATSNTYTTPNNLTVNSYYRVQISNAATGCNIVTSNPVTVFIAKVTKQPTDPNPICVGGTVQMSVEATSNGGTAVPIYQWQSSPTGTGNWTNIAGATNELYTSQPLLTAGTTYYRCLMSSLDPVCGVPSVVVKAVVVADPVITSQPVGGTICESGTFDLSVVAVNDAAPLNYQWEQSINGTSGWTPVIGGIGANSPNYRTPNLTMNTYYRVSVTSAGANNGCNAIVSNSTLVAVVESPTITLQPTKGEECINQPHTFTVAASGNVSSSALTYQWQTAPTLTGVYEDVVDGTGGTTNTYTTPPYATIGDRFFRVLVSQSQSGCETQSDNVVLTVLDRPVAPTGLTVQPSCENSTGMVAITNPDLGSGYEYSKDGITFQASNEFKNLAPGTTVTIYTRKVGLVGCGSVGTAFPIYNRICAIPETFLPILGDTGGNTGTQTILDSDEINGVVLDPNDVTLTVNSISSYLTLNPDNTITVAPGTPADYYSLTYTICEKANPDNCSSTTETIDVSTDGIDARIDVVPFIVNGYIDNPSVINVLANDRIATTTPATISNVTISVEDRAEPKPESPNTNVPFLDVSTGDVIVPAGTFKGLYTIRYRICEIAAPSECDEADILVQVGTTVIDANDDRIDHINGYVGQLNALNAITSNDNINGVPITAQDLLLQNIIVTRETEAVPLYPGAKVPTFSPFSGVVNVPPGTPANTYYIKYHICEKLNPTNCSDASIAIVVDPAPIVAEDDLVIDVNGYTGANNIINAYTNVRLDGKFDTYNGEAININLVDLITPSILTPAFSINGGPVPELVVANGRVNVPPGTPAGDYEIQYQLCENLNTVDAVNISNCDDAIVKIRVIAPEIIAEDDEIFEIDGYTGANNVLYPYDNDSLNGGTLDISTITTTVITPAVSNNGAPVPVLNLATGSVDVPAGTPKGNYTITYQICENLNPQNCDLATITVGVLGATIIAVDDETPVVNGFEEHADIYNVLTNDELNGLAVISSEVELTVISPFAASINGGRVPFLDTDTGFITVPAGTTAGTYYINYRIAELKDLNNRDEATVTINVTAPTTILAEDDAATGINGNDGKNAVVDVLANDILEATSPTVDDVNIKVITGAEAISGGLIPILDVTTGLVNVPAGTSSGVYTIVYEICEKANLANCDDAEIKITVTVPEITLVKRGTFEDTNGDGFAQPGETIRYNFLVKNTGSIDLTNVRVTDPKVTVSGNPIASLLVGALNVTNFTATYVLTQTDINNGEVINQATVTAMPVFGTEIQDLSDSDDPTLLGDDDPTVTPLTQRKELTLIKGGTLIGDGSVGDVIEYSFVVTNTGNVILTNVEIDDVMFANPKIEVTPSTLAPGESGTASATYTLTIGDVANGQVVNTALAVGDAPDGTVVTDISDSTDPTLTGKDDPTVVDLNLNPSIAIVKKGTFVDANGNGYAEIGETINLYI